MTVPLSLLCGEQCPLSSAWPCPVIPLAVHVLQYPAPSGPRCVALGQANCKAVHSHEQDLRVHCLGNDR
ncbi:MAG: hypothetical protein EST26_05425 [Hydrogenophaga sp.]|nr:hypothetical protein [Hydrogenophaga sp.]